jgi:hypothetical protein
LPCLRQSQTAIPEGMWERMRERPEPFAALGGEITHESLPDEP